MRFIVVIGAIIGAFFLAGALFLSKGAPQEAAMAAMAVAFAVIPYVIYRVLSVAKAERQREQIIDLLTARSQ